MILLSEQEEVVSRVIVDMDIASHYQLFDLFDPYKILIMHCSQPNKVREVFSARVVHVSHLNKKSVFILQANHSVNMCNVKNSIVQLLNDTCMLLMDICK